MRPRFSLTARTPDLAQIESPTLYCSTSVHDNLFISPSLSEKLGGEINDGTSAGPKLDPLPGAYLTVHPDGSKRIRTPPFPHPFMYILLHVTAAQTPLLPENQQGEVVLGGGGSGGVLGFMELKVVDCSLCIPRCGRVLDSERSNGWRTNSRQNSLLGLHYICGEIRRLKEPTISGPINSLCGMSILH